MMGSEVVVMNAPRGHVRHNGGVHRLLQKKGLRVQWFGVDICAALSVEEGVRVDS